MAAVVRRNTSAYPIERARALLAFAAAGWKLGRVDVVLRGRGDGWISGHADIGGWSQASRRRIVVSIGRRWRRTRYQLKYAPGAPELVEGSIDEAVLYVLAHEVRHIIQARYARPRDRVWGTRGQYSERDAEAFGLRVLRRWRREGGFANG